MVAQIVDKLFHLMRQGMGFDQRHALDVALGPSFCFFDCVKQIAPPDRFFCRFRFGNVESQRVFEFRRIYLISDQRHVKERGGDGSLLQYSCLAQMQPARAVPDHCLTLFDAYDLVSFLVKVCQAAIQRFQDIFNTLHQVGPIVRHRVFYIEHHAWRAAVEHFAYEFSIIGGLSHLIALVQAPAGQFDLPVIGRCRGRRQMIGQLAGLRSTHCLGALGNQLLLTGSQRSMERHQEIQKARWQICRCIETCWSRIHADQYFVLLFARRHRRI